ncbi:hypothetical protein CHS0354_030030 [Potamilus streckersoni]|uniref:Fibronectin type-III domain-containing protein n=1 Tax=Potamilus streckersoni TaxID=2493646 RepID=A0AAE0SEC9_9BIVA|nr:hypothetical protein CHS0354_030030 [Potamilus streckersoni]
MYLYALISDVPEVPSNVTITDVKQTSLTVQWFAGHSGGLEQIFHIVITASDATRSFHAPDPGNGKVGTYILEDLIPNTEYSIYMSASNTVGPSNMTNVIFQTTLKGPSMNESIGIPYAWIAGTVSAGLFGILVGVTGILLWRRFHHSKESQHESDSQGVCEVRIERRDQKPNNTARESEYEELHAIRTEANEYIELNGITAENNTNADTSVLSKCSGNSLSYTTMSVIISGSPGYVFVFGVMPAKSEKWYPKM